MNPSQVRRLARAFAQGSLERGEYLDQRRRTINAICAGEEAITYLADPIPERPRPAPDPAPSAAAGASTAAMASADRISRRLLWAGGAAVVAIVVLIVWVAYPTPAPQPPAPPTPVPQRQVPAARALVESFLVGSDWSELALARFVDDWERLPAAEREQALAAPWMNRMRNAVRRESRTQRALAEVDDTGAAQATIERLAQFAARIGIADRSAAKPAQAIVAPQEPAPEPPADSAPVESAAPAAAPPSEGAGRAWLAEQPADAYTLQLFALGHLDRVERIIASHPEVELHVIASDSGVPRYRVLVGSYPNEARARAAFETLPAGVRREQPNPLVKSFADLQRMVGMPATATSAPPAAAAAGFTVQVFVSNNRDNVDRLIASYPGLGLRIHDAPGAALRYRVLMGSFASRAAAESAAARVPKELVRAAGKPLVKSLSELGAG